MQAGKGIKLNPALCPTESLKSDKQHDGIHGGDFKFGNDLNECLTIMNLMSSRHLKVFKESR